MSYPGRLVQEIIGHETQREQLVSLISQGTFPHATLLTGPAGIGKRTLARALAGLLSVGDLAQEEALRSAENLLLKGTHPDIHFLSRDPEKKDLSVELLRETCKKLQLKPYSSKHSVAIIDNAEEMSIAASNALLMTLEEPPPHSFLILVSAAPHRLPETIVSRCQSVHFGELSREHLTSVVRRLLPGEEQLVTDLMGFTSGSLTDLHLSTHINPRTLLVDDQEHFVASCRSFVKDCARLRERISRAMDGSGGTGGLLSLAADVTAEKDSLPLVWQLLRQLARDQLRQGDSAQADTRASELLNILASEKLSRERSLNPQLQLSSILLRYSE